MLNMLAVHQIEMPAQPIAHGLRQHDAAILLALAAPHHDFTSIEIDVFDPQLQTFLEA